MSEKRDWMPLIARRREAAGVYKEEAFVGAMGYHYFHVFGEGAMREEAAGKVRGEELVHDGAVGEGAEWKGADLG
jgi:hypothetical protein